ncbi:MAG: glycoside hydrolase family 9 protein [Oscillospiraceae bacterium]|nr:glycoside hydrolase family 9 protein [Oscillospiraceae bacterium]
MNRMKKIISSVLAFAMLAGTIQNPVSLNSADAASTQNYAEALQKSLFFYEAQQAGPLPEWNRVEWKTDSTMTDEVLGGWYDAGDHVKFNLPMAYSASMLAWGMYMYPEGLKKSGLMTSYAQNVEFVMDYLADCDKGTEVVYQVGNGTIDHTWWGPISLIQYGMEDSGTSYESAREALKASKGCSAVFGEMAAALAAGYLALDGQVDDAKRKGYLEHAENIFKLADASKSDDVYNDSDASGFYRSSHFYDELFYAANWLYMATKDSKYLDLAKSYIPNLGRMLGEGDVLAYGWSHCWDDTLQGGMLLYAINTNDADAVAHVKKHLNRWVNGDEAKILPGGLRWLTTWGCLRYANTAAFLASVASDTILKGEDNSKLTEFAEAQINYSLGDNPDKRSYVVGYGENSPQNPHHRTAHGSWKNDLDYPATNRHILYGALVGGPGQDGSYKDNRGDYISNEVATDYNSGFTAMLCKMIQEHGGTPDPSFPQPEKHDGPEFFVEALSKGADASGITVSFKITNHSAWPARAQDNISFRYYMDLSEVKAAGKNPEDVVIRCDRDQSAMYASSGVKPAVISPVKQYDGDIYYVEVTLPDGRAVLPISEGMQKCEILLALVMPDYGSGWDAENDPSNKDILGAKGTADAEGTVTGIISKYIPVYIDGKLYYGTEPDGTTADGNASADPKPDVKPTDKPSAPASAKPTDEPAVKPSPSEAPTPATAPSSPATVKPSPSASPVPSSKPTSGSEQPGSDSPISSEPSKVLGDVNCDGKIDITDISVLSLALLDKKLPEGQAFTNSDVDRDKEIGLTDLSTLKQYVSKVITKFPE